MCGVLWVVWWCCVEGCVVVMVVFLCGGVVLCRGGVAWCLCGDGAFYAVVLWWCCVMVCGKGCGGGAWCFGVLWWCGVVVVVW